MNILFKIYNSSFGEGMSGNDVLIRLQSVGYVGKHSLLHVKRLMRHATPRTILVGVHESLHIDSASESF